jgi:hypothetical protein
MAKINASLVPHVQVLPIGTTQGINNLPTNPLSRTPVSLCTLTFAQLGWQVKELGHI